MNNGLGSERLNGASLHNHLLGECIAMAKYALASGLKVPPGLMQDLEDLSTYQINGSLRGLADLSKQATWRARPPHTTGVTTRSLGLLKYTLGWPRSWHRRPHGPFY
jgi:hypothetical protein